MVGIHFGATNFRHAVAARVKPLAGAHLHTHMHPPNLISALVLFGTNIIFLPASGNYARKGARQFSLPCSSKHLLH